MNQENKTARGKGIFFLPAWYKKEKQDGINIFCFVTNEKKKKKRRIFQKWLADRRGGIFTETRKLKERAGKRTERRGTRRFNKSKIARCEKKKLGIRERVVVVVHGYTRMIKRRSVFSHVIARNLLQKSKDRLENKEIYNGTRGRKKNMTKDNITMSIPYISVWLMHAWIHEILLLIMVWRARRWESNQLEEEKKKLWFVLVAEWRQFFHAAQRWLEWKKREGH